METYGLVGGVAESVEAPRVPRLPSCLARRRRPRRLRAFVPPPAAFAKRHSIAASARHHNFLVFKLADIAPHSVRSARLRMGRHARRMPVRAVRAAARRGKLRTRVPKRWRRSSRSSHRTQRGASARAHQRPPKLVLTINSSVPSAPTTVTPPAPPPSPPAPLPAGAKFVSASGSDSDPGTESAPWRTIAKAISAARPGDTIVLAAGTYGARGTTTNGGHERHRHGADHLHGPSRPA